MQGAAQFQYGLFSYLFWSPFGWSPFGGPPCCWSPFGWSPFGGPPCCWSPLKLYTLYAPPNHRDGVVHHTRADAEAKVEGRSCSVFYQRLGDEADRLGARLASQSCNSPKLRRCFALI